MLAHLQVNSIFFKRYTCNLLVSLHRYNYGKDSYDLGSGFGHFALAVPDVYKTVESIKSAGARLRSGLCCLHLR